MSDPHACDRRSLVDIRIVTQLEGAVHGLDLPAEILDLLRYPFIINV